MRVIVTSKSREFNKKNYSVRYITAQVEGVPKMGVCFSIYNGRYPPIYRILEIPLRELTTTEIKKYHKNVDGEQFKIVQWVNGFKQDEIVDTGEYYTEYRTQEVPLENAMFYTDHLEVDEMKIPASDLGFNHLPTTLNGVTLEGSILITGKFEKRIRRVYDSKINRYEFKPRWFFKEGTADTSNCDLRLLEEVVLRERHDLERDELLEKIKHALRQGTFVSEDWFDEFSFSDLFGDMTKEELLLSLTMKKEYEPIFFDMLKERHDQTREIFYSSRGFLFYISGNIVWEEPKYGSATYVFEDKLTPEQLTASLNEVTKSDILTNTQLQDLLGFKWRAIHPNDSEDDSSLTRWMVDIERNI